MAGLLEKYWAEGKRLHPFGESGGRLRLHAFMTSLTLQREAANASQPARNFRQLALNLHSL